MVYQHSIKHSGQQNAGSQLGVSIFDFDFYCKSYSYPLQCLHYCLRKYVIYAYISIIESILKLLIVYVLCISPSDKLILYAILLCGVAIICTFIYKIYCCKKF